jgi:hypothetical protein
MPDDTPQQDRPTIDQALEDLRDAMEDTTTVLNTVIAMRREGYLLLQLLPGELRSLKEQIARLLPS